MDESKVIADVLREVFISPNVSDSNFEPANLVDTTNHLAQAMTRIANALERIAAGLDGQPPKAS